jgi:hypothetical protein
MAIPPPRPKGQDKRPKSFHLSSIQMVLEYEPTERWILWIIAKYPYVFNMYFLSDIIQSSKDDQTTEDSKLGRALKTLRSLKTKGFVKQNKNRLKWKITLKGQLHRFVTHPQYDIFKTSFQTLIAIGIAATVFILSRKFPVKQEVPSTKEKLEIHAPDSSLHEHRLVVDSVGNVVDSERIKK